MKHFFTFLCACLITLSASAQTTFAIKGRVFDKLTGETLPGATVQVSGNGQTGGAGADSDGAYKIANLPSGTYTVQASFVGYKNLSQKVVVGTQNATASFGLTADNASLDEVQVVATLAQERSTPVAFSAVNEVKLRETLSNRDLPMILNETPGVYATQGGGGTGDSRITVRGFDQRNVAVMVNGVPVNDMENGQVFWSNWDLGDVTKSLQVQRGLSASKIAVPSVGGTINVLTKGYDDKRSAIARLETGSNNYRKASLMLSSGPLKGDWAFTVFGSRRTSDGWVDKTFDDAWTYFGNISKRVGNHRFSLTGLGSPQQHGQRSFARPIAVYSSEKAQELGARPVVGGNQGFDYNPHWGYLNRYPLDAQHKLVTTGGQAKVLNERINYYHKPQINLNHFWTVNDRLSVSNVVYASFGTGGGTAGTGGISVPSTGQIDFQKAYNTNAVNFPKVGNTVNYAGEREASAGYLYNNANNHHWYGFVSGLDFNLRENLTLSAGIDGRYYYGEHYREIRDLLGGDYIRNTSNANADPTTHYHVGDKIAFHNDSKVQWLGGYGQLEYKTPVLSAVVSGTLSQIGYKRIDYFKKGIVETDYVRINGYSAKAGANYNLTEHDNLFVNVGYNAKVPFFNFVFDTNTGQKFPNVKTEGVSSLEFGYGISYPSLKANLNAYYTLWTNKSTSSVAFDAGLGQNVYSNVRNVNARHAGVELSVAQEISRRLQLNAAIGLGDWRWTGKGLLNKVTEANEAVGEVDQPIYLDGVHVGDAAQNQFQFGVRYEPFKGFYVRPSFLLFTKYYAGFDPSTFSQEANRTDSYRVPTSRNLDIHFGYDLARLWNDRVKLGFKASVLNVLNEFYITDVPAVGSTGFSDPDKISAFFNRGRTFTVGLSATL